MYTKTGRCLLKSIEGNAQVILEQLDIIIITLSLLREDCDQYFKVSEVFANVRKPNSVK
jgi:hypothetical protein